MGNPMPARVGAEGVVGRGVGLKSVTRTGKS